jgi:hypothetical protein
MCRWLKGGCRSSIDLRGADRRAQQPHHAPRDPTQRASQLLRCHCRTIVSSAAGNSFVIQAMTAGLKTGTVAMQSAGSQPSSMRACCRAAKRPADERGASLPNDAKAASVTHSWTNARMFAGCWLGTTITTNSAGLPSTPLPCTISGAMEGGARPTATRGPLVGWKRVAVRSTTRPTPRCKSSACSVETGIRHCGTRRPATR